MTDVFKTIFGTDAEVKTGIVRPSESPHVTEVLASHAEDKIDRMNAATERLAKFQPARNLAEALNQIVGE